MNITAWSIQARGSKEEVRTVVEAAVLHDHGGADELASAAALASAKVAIFERIAGLSVEQVHVLAFGPRVDLHPGASATIIVEPGA